MKYTAALKFMDKEYSKDFISAKRDNCPIKYVEYCDKNIDTYDIVLIDNKLCISSNIKHIIFTDNEKTNQGIYKYFSYEKIDKLIIKQIESIKTKGTKLICIIDQMGDLDSKNYLREEINDSKESLFINISYSINSITKSEIDISKMIYYTFSSEKEKDYLINKSINTTWKYVEGFYSLEEMTEFNTDKIKKFIQIIKTNTDFSKIYFNIEPGFNFQLIEFSDQVKMFVILDDNLERIKKYSKYLLEKDKNIRILPIHKNKKMNKLLKSSCLNSLYFGKECKMTDRMDEIFE